MKIVCLIRYKPGAFHMVNAVHKKYPVSLIVLERPELRTGVLGFLQRIRKGWGKSTPLSDIPLMEVCSVNDKSVQARLAALKPDIILDHGTSIVKEHILSCAPTTLNIHWGLSPYYRGTHCTQWALINRDPLNIGVTVHALASEVDGGGIAGQTRVVPEPHDTVRSINEKLSHAGTTLILRALDILSSGKTLTFHPQDLSQGLLTRSRDYTPHIAARVAEIENQGLGEILSHPSRERLFIIEIN